MFPAETAHYISMKSLKLLCAVRFIRNLITGKYKSKCRKQYSIFNIQFNNRIGLGAGFDKNAKYLREIDAIGFGFVEIGTVTPKPQQGNDKPRLFRLPKDKALINRMGFNNDGAEVIAERLRLWRQKNSKFKIQNSKLIIGGNIGKNKTTNNEDAWKDYEICFDALHNYVDFFVVNVSSPNTHGLRELQEKVALKEILTNLQAQNLKYEFRKPILLKIAPDLTWMQIDDVIDLASEIKLDGIVATNTSVTREFLGTNLKRVNKIGSGGLSGQPLKKRSTEIIKYIHEKTNGALPIIASGGIFTAGDAGEKINAGAALCEVWTGFIYEGPSIVKHNLKYSSAKSTSNFCGIVFP